MQKDTKEGKEKMKKDTKRDREKYKKQRVKENIEKRETGSRGGTETCKKQGNWL